MPTAEESLSRRKTVALSDFLLTDDDLEQDQEDDEEDDDDETDENIFTVKRKSKVTADTDVIKCGTMKKKGTGK